MLGDLVYDRAGLCAAMGCGYKRARRILDDYGITPIDYGKGRAGGLRWLKSDVTRCLNTQAQNTAPTPQTMQNVQCTHKILGVSINDLYCQLNPKKEPVQ